MMEGIIGSLKEELERREHKERNRSSYGAKSELAETTAISHLSLISSDSGVLNGLLENT